MQEEYEKMKKAYRDRVVDAAKSETVSGGTAGTDCRTDLSLASRALRWKRLSGRLKGDEIPISAQVVSLADVYDALTNERVYKKAIPHEKAIEMIVTGECGQFNPLLIECLLEIKEDIPIQLMNAEYRNSWTPLDVGGVTPS